MGFFEASALSKSAMSAGEESRFAKTGPFPLTMETSIPGIFVAGTATAGTQGSFKVYIENSHIHAQRIAAHLAGEPVPGDPVLPELPEA